MKALKGLLIILLISAVIGGGYYYYFYNELEESLRLDLPNSSQHDNGTWWGYNQSKIVSLQDTTFTYYIDNSDQVNGVANLNNPNKSVLIKIKDGEMEEFGTHNSSRPGNILADKARNKIYYIVVEPTSAYDNGTEGKTMLFEYDYNIATDTVTFVRSEEVVKSGSVGKIRSSATLDSQGNIAIAYGDYDGYMQVHIYEIETMEWTNHTIKSNLDNDLLMYPYLIMKDPDNFYLLAVQDTLIGNECYYQYVMFFTYNSGLWKSSIIVDYRDLDIASSRYTLVDHTEFYLMDDKIHIITRGSLSPKEGDYSGTFEYFIYDNGNLKEQDASHLKSYYNWVKIVPMGGKYYYVSNSYRALEIMEYDTHKVVYRTRNIPKGAYVYINKEFSDEEIQIMLCPGNVDHFDTSTLLLQFKG